LTHLLQTRLDRVQISSHQGLQVLRSLLQPVLGPARLGGAGEHIERWR
jgi:hypothetical protein